MVPRWVIGTVLVATLAAFAASAAAFPSSNPANKMVSEPIEDYRYDHAKRCVKRPTRGAAALQEWLEDNVRGVSWGIMRCERLSEDNFSLHAAGRAIDWHLDVTDPDDRREARRLIDMLLASDRADNPHALARRMGIQEIIWNCRSWWSGSDKMGRYSLCYDRKGRRTKIGTTLAHRDHIHIGLNLPGARMRTSFWRR